MATDDSQGRHLGLFGATGVGVGAIVGGGILALSGVAFATTGPAAILAFGLNGLIALFTALSFAEMASKFPQSGGTYTFAKKVLSVDTAFLVGWVVWFASIVAAVLYSLGFAYFLLIMIQDLALVAGYESPSWIMDRIAVKVVAIGATLLLGGVLLRSAKGGGQGANVAKVAIFVFLVLSGFWALTRQSPAELSEKLSPFFAAGFYGLIQAMGYTFIALQGFDLIAAVGGEVKQPEKNLPRAILASLAIALAIYLPFLLVSATAGVPAGDGITVMAEAQPESVIAMTVQNYLGGFGYWLVVVVAVLSMFSALQANLFAASRIAQTMASDRNLPGRLATSHVRYQTPTYAVLATVGVVLVLLIIVSDVSAAGAASSLIFLLTFALAHWSAILVRQRSNDRPPPFRTIFFPTVPVIGGVACVGLAVFQGIAVPRAGLIAIVWLSIGAVLFLLLFARRARVRDASSRAFDPELLRLRGQAPLVLAPIANPGSVQNMLAIAHSLVPPGLGRVMALNVVSNNEILSQGGLRREATSEADGAGEVLSLALQAAAKSERQVEVVGTLSEEPLQEIARVAKLHQCETVVLGVGHLHDQERNNQLETLFGSLSSDVVVVKADPEWQLSRARRLLVPVAGRGGNHHLLARLLAAMVRDEDREITLLRVLSEDSTSVEETRALRDLTRLAEDTVRGKASVSVVRHADPVAAIVEHQHRFDLTILGMQRTRGRSALITEFTRRLAAEGEGPLVMLSQQTF